MSDVDMNQNGGAVVGDEYNYDVDKAVLAKEGNYGGRIDKVGVDKNDDGFFYFRLAWVLDQAYDEANVDSVGMTVDERITVFPENVVTNIAKINKQSLQRLLKSFEIDSKMFPRRVNKETLQAFADEFLTGRTKIVRVVHKPKADDPATIYTNIRHPSSTAETVDVEPAEAAPPAEKPKKNKKHQQ